MQIHCLTNKLSASKIDLDQANEQHGSATNMIVSLKQYVRACEGVSDEIEFTSGALVNAKDELVCARMEIEKKNDTIRVVRAELKYIERSRMNMLHARETLNEATKGIRTNAQAHEDTVDGLDLATTSLYRETQDKALKDAEVAGITL
jgi:hypothetical protein